MSDLCTPGQPCKLERCPFCDPMGYLQEPPTDTEEPPTDTDDKQAAKSAATVIAELMQERYQLGVTEGGETYAIPRTGPQVVRPLRGGRASLRAELAREYYRRTGRAAGQQALSDALMIGEGIAQDAPPRELCQRVGQADGALWLDLGDGAGRAVRIAGGSWELVDRPPLLFRRTELTGALPVPNHGGDLSELWDWLNVAEEDRPLVLAWLVSGFWSDIPHPILGLFGEQGTGKTTALKLLVSLVDPGPVPYRKAPRDPESWVTAAVGSWLVGLDNLSTVPDWLSDSLCRAVTGDGDVRRKLYTDGELVAFAFRRVIAVTGIDLGALNGDLADRLLSVSLSVIPEAQRRDERGLWSGWSAAHPRLLGALLDLVARVETALPSVELVRKPRMADFARVLAAVDQVLGTGGLDRYADSQRRMAEESLQGDPFIRAVADYLAGSDGYSGTAGALLHLVTPTAERPPKGWPGNPRLATVRLTRQAPVLRKAGWTVTDDGGRNKQKTRIWTLIPPTGSPHAEESGNPDPPDPPAPLFPGQRPFSATESLTRLDPLGGSGKPAGGSGRVSGGSAAGQRRVKAGLPYPPKTAGQEAVAGQAGMAGQESASPPVCIAPGCSRPARRSCETCVDHMAYAE